MQRTSIWKKLKFTTVALALLGSIGYFGAQHGLKQHAEQVAQQVAADIVEGGKLIDEVDQMNASSTRLAEIAKQQGVDPAVTAFAQVKLGQQMSDKYAKARENLKFVVKAAGDNVPESLASTLNLRSTVEEQADRLIGLAINDGAVQPSAGLPTSAPRANVQPTSYEANEESSEDAQVALNENANMHFVSVAKETKKPTRTGGFSFRVGK